MSRCEDAAFCAGGNANHIEHVTAIFASALLADQKRFCEPMHDDYRLLRHWHAVEEIEHKAVAFDVYQQTGGEYGLRLLAAIEVAVFFPVVLFFSACFIVGQGWVVTRSW